MLITLNDKFSIVKRVKRNRVLHYERVFISHHWTHNISFFVLDMFTKTTQKKI